jgi:DNA topoisomerase-2
MIKRPVSVSPALLKIFDEIVVNAADNFSRSNLLREIRVNVERPEANKLLISVQNDGPSIPIQLHPTEGIYVPELIFGHLLTGSNFNDKDTRFTGGSHGYGAKLTNIFSNEFRLSITDSESSQIYEQLWKKNMSECSVPKVTQLTNQSSEVKSEVKIVFEPDLLKFGFDSLPEQVRSKHLDDIVAMFERRTIDIAGCLGNVNVYFNSQKLELKSFDEYAHMFLNSSAEGEHEMPLYKSVELANQWQIGLAVSPSDTFESLSFVNNVWTPRGGTHVQTIMAQISKFAEKELKIRGVKKATPASIKENLMLFLNSKVENPSFDGQTKDALISKASSFSKDATLTTDQLQMLLVDSGIVDEITRRFLLLEDSRLQAITRKSSKRTFIDVPKLEDAHLAGTNRSLECTLILTEGDSAKALAVAGISAIGRELFGVMPLRGKLLNVRVANTAAISKNEELINLCKAVGLEFGKSYRGSSLEDEGLRYGKVMLMCDQDHDGSHIKGLIINFFDHFWPELLKHEGFLQEFITPIVKVKGQPSTNETIGFGLNEISSSNSHKGRSKTIQKSFYSLADYQEWRQHLSPKELNRYHIKYYKGLGTSTATEGQEYFREIDQHRKLFALSVPSKNATNSEGTVTAEEDSVSVNRDAIDLVFNKSRVEDRKNWLLNSYSKDLSIDLRESTVTYKDFVAKELIHFSFSDNLRSIPSVIDGLKPSQRKVLYGCFKKNLVKEELKVVQLAGYIAEQTAYHHGEAALHSTIINMAQDFVGANNLPLLEPIGQFGTRAKGGHDFASARYIFTKLSPLARLLFPASDDAILQYQEEDGLTVEPKYYLPIIPFVLVNGTQGIGTGWSTNIPPHHPLQIISAVEVKLNRYQNSVNSALYESTGLSPWFAGFQGEISTRFESQSSRPSVTVKSTTETAPLHADESSSNDEIDKFEDNHEFHENVGSTASESSESTPEIFDGTYFLSRGSVHRVDRTTMRITELPVLKWTEDYKSFLVSLVEKGKIKAFKEMHTPEKVCFEVTAPGLYLDRLFASSSSPSSKNGPFISKLESTFRLTSKINLNNMHAFSAEGKMHRYQSAEEILDHHFEERLLGYEQRKAALVREQIKHEAMSRNKARFVDDLLTGELKLSSTASSDNSGWRARPVADIERELRELGYDTIDAIQQTQTQTQPQSSRPYDYLLSMSLQSLTLERAQALKQQARHAQEQLQLLQEQSPTGMWLADLKRLREGYELYLSNRYSVDEAEAALAFVNNAVTIHRSKRKSSPRKRTKKETFFEQSSN